MEDRITRDGERINRSLETLKNKEVVIGFQHGMKVDDNGVDICDKAMFNELGTSTIPSRPFMRNAFDNHEVELENFMKLIAGQIIDGMSPEQALANIGIKMTNLVMNEIYEGSFEPNAPSTLRQKSGDKPLIDSGLMYKSVLSTVRRKGGQ